MTVNSSISSTEFYEGEEITLTATPDSGANGNLFYWVINFTTNDLQYTIQELTTQGKIFKQITSTGTYTATGTATVTQQANSINTLTPLLLQVPTTQYIGNAISTALNSNDFFADTGTTYNITWVNPPASNQKTISGIVTWLRQWFYTKTEFDTKEDDTGWQLMTPSSGYEYYNSSYDSGKLWIRRVNKLVEIRGVVKPTAQKTASTEGVQFATIPSGYRPSYQFRMAICQGSGIQKYTLAANTNGALTWARYGVASSINVPSGAWLTVHIIYELDS